MSGHMIHGEPVPSPAPAEMAEAYLTVAAFIRGGLEGRHEETACGLAVTGADETRRVASAALDVATMLLRSHAEGLGLDPIDFLDLLVRSVLEAELTG